jgi:hypothetical protein
MASSGPNSGSSAANVSDSGFAWTNPSNALTADGSSATASPLSGESTDWLQVTGFGFSIPAGATVNGVVVEVKIGASATDAFDTTAVQLVTGGAAEGVTRSDSGNIPTTAAYVSVGGPTDLWGGTWTPAKVNAATFGAWVKTFADAGPPAVVSIDHVRVTVYYTAAGGPSVRRALLGVG